MSERAREKARERGQKSGKGTQTMSRLLSWLGVGGPLAYVLGESNQDEDEQDE